jgi:hypothetical protein
MKAILFTIIFAGLLGGGATFAYLYYGGFSGEGSTGIAFIEVYGDYNEIATGVETLVHVPGVADNKDREDLEQLLNTILVDNITNEEREKLARVAFSHLDTIKKEIDQAQASQAQLYQVLQDLDVAAKQLHGLEAKGVAEEIVVTARERAEHSARITSILSETNDHTYAIITQILGAGGALSQSQIQSINDSTNAAESRYDTLSRLYDELVLKRTQVEQQVQQFANLVI